MGKKLRDESTESGRRIWAAVDKAASRAPQWVKDRLAAIEKGESDAS